MKFAAKRFCCTACMLLALMLCFGSCRNNPTEPEAQTSGEGGSVSLPADTGGDVPALPEAVVSYPMTEIRDRLKLTGRHQVLADGITFDHTASGVEFSSYCEGDVTLTLFSEGDSYFTVWIDGVMKRTRLHAGDGVSTVTVARYLEEGIHTIRIVKQTESRLSRTVFQSLALRGTIGDAPEDRALYLEWIGDSITCGAGNLTSGTAADAGAAVHQDGTQAYAFLTAEALEADCSVVSCSGIGVVQGYVDFNISDFYACESYYRSSSEPYEPARVPDVVVINLGTNDAANGADAGAFSDGVRGLVGQIRELYGEVPIVWAYNMMSEGTSSLVRAVFREMGGEEAGLFTVSLSRDTAGGNGHPSVSGHEKAAAELSEFLTRKGLTDGTWRDKTEEYPSLDAEEAGPGMSLPWADGLAKFQKED